MKTILFIVQVIFLLNLNTSYAQLPIAANGKYMEVNKAELYYEEYGQGEPLFLLHGFLGSAEDWKGFVQEYSKTYKVIVWDMRGHGRSTNPDTSIVFKHEQAAQDLIGLMDKLEIDKTKAIGHSSGGMTILYAATIAPDRFDAIIPVAAQIYYSRQVREFIKSKTWEKYFPQVELDRRHGRQKGDLLKRQFYNSWQIYGDPSFTPDELAKIKARTLIVHGDNDFVPVSQAWEMFQSIPKAHIWISPNTGHVPFSPGNEADFIRRTLEFLEGEGW